MVSESVETAAGFGNFRITWIGVKARAGMTWIFSNLDHEIISLIFLVNVPEIPSYYESYSTKHTVARKPSIFFLNNSN